jgi:hypothetical protein
MVQNLKGAFAPCARLHGLLDTNDKVAGRLEDLHGGRVPLLLCGSRAPARDPPLGRDWRELWRERPLDRLNKPNAARLLIRGSEVRILPGAKWKAPLRRGFRCLSRREAVAVATRLRRSGRCEVGLAP